MPKISVIVPVYNEERIVGDCLKALTGLDYPKDRLELIIIDNNSTDKSASIIRGFDVRYFFEKRRNRSIARNTGIRAACGDYIAFTDADCIVDRDWLRRLMTGFDGGRVGGCGGRTVSYKPSNFIERYLDWFFFKKQFVKTGNFVEDFFTGLIFGTHNLIFRADVLRRTGLFDEKMTASEDIDLVWRVCLHGYQVRYAPSAVVRHRRKASFTELMKEVFEYTYWQYVLLRKYDGMLGISIDWFLHMLNILRVPAELVRISMRQETDTRFLYALFDCLWDLAAPVTGFYARMQSGLEGIRYSSPGFAPERVIWRRDADGGVMVLDIGNRRGFRLDDMAALMWEKMNIGKSKEEIAADIGDIYDVDKKTVISDLEDMLKDIGCDTGAMAFPGAS